MIRLPALLFGLVVIVAVFAHEAIRGALTALARHMGSSGRPRRSGLGPRWEAHQSARLGFTTSTRER